MWIYFGTIQEARRKSTGASITGAGSLFLGRIWISAVRVKAVKMCLHLLSLSTKEWYYMRVGSAVLHYDWSTGQISRRSSFYI